MKNLFLTLLLIVMAGSTAIAQKGHLIIVGGGGTTNKIKEHRAQYTGGTANSSILVVPYADLKGFNSAVK